MPGCSSITRRPARSWWDRPRTTRPPAGGCWNSRIRRPDRPVPEASGQDLHLAQLLDHPGGRLLRRHDHGVDAELGIFRRLVGGVDAGEVRELAATRLGVQPLLVALLGDGERCVHEDLAELTLAEHVGAIRRSERNGEMNETSTISPALTMLRM